MHAAPVEGAEELFGTETMAELCVRQGRLGDALAIYRRLVARGGDDARRERWSARLSSLEALDGEKTESPPAPAAQASQASQDSAAEAPVAAAPVAPAPAPRASLVVREPVRSGQVVYAQGTDLIVLAPVNAGAQLMADGHIHVYAALRGRAVAGVRGDRDARIFCQRLEAELVGVDAAYLTAEDIPGELLGRPAQVWLDEGRCRVKAL